MQSFYVLITQIFSIICIELVLSSHFNEKRHSLWLRIISSACYLGSLYLLIVFLRDNVLTRLIHFI